MNRQFTKMGMQLAKNVWKEMFNIIIGQEKEIK